MKYRDHFDKEKRLVTVHFNMRILEDDNYLQFTHPKDNLEKQPLYVVAIYYQAGIEEVWVRHHSIAVQIGLLFNEKELLKMILSAVLNVIDREGTLEEDHAPISEPQKLITAGAGLAAAESQKAQGKSTTNRLRALFGMKPVNA